MKCDSSYPASTAVSGYSSLAFMNRGKDPVIVGVLRQQQGVGTKLG